MQSEAAQGDKNGGGWHTLLEMLSLRPYTPEAKGPHPLPVRHEDR
jgi:hypothetical protein